MTDKTLTLDNLRQFTGTETWYRHWANKNVLYTDGVQYVAETAGAYWLIDAIVLNQSETAVHAEAFQVWKLKVDLSASKAVLICEDGNGNTVFNKDIEYTDFPLAEIKFYFTDKVLMLTGEY